MKSKEGLGLEMLLKILKAFRRILLALRTFKDALFFSPHHHPMKMCAQRENKRVHHTYLYFLRPDLIWWLMEKQEAKKSFASPDYLFYGKSHIVKQLYCKNGCK